MLTVAFLYRYGGGVMWGTKMDSTVMSQAPAQRQRLLFWRITGLYDAQGSNLAPGHLWPQGREVCEM
jgi:hypothetical protein